MSYTKLLIAALVLAFSGGVNASILNNGNHVTVDGIEWLDLTETDGWSYTQTLALTGYHVATTVEFKSMFAMFSDPDDQFGIDVPASEYCTSSVESQVCYSKGDTGFVDNLFSAYFGGTQLGSTSAFSSVYSYGWYADGTETRLGGIAAVDRVDPTVDDKFFEYHSGSRDYGHIAAETTQWGFSGWFMVENSSAATVPEPSILALMGLGLAGIGFARRRRQT